MLMVKRKVNVGWDRLLGEVAGLFDDVGVGVVGGFDYTWAVGLADDLDSVSRGARAKWLDELDIEFSRRRGSDHARHFVWMIEN